MKAVIIKTGALGDVVRTQYFAKYLCEQKNYKITWLTSPAAKPILDGNPYIVHATTNPRELEATQWDIVYNLEDETEYCELKEKINADKWIGMSLREDGGVTYDATTAPWNDMGIHSRFGLNEANSLKLKNTRSHLEIFETIFNVKNVIPNWKGAISIEKNVSGSRLIVGCNFFAGNRWPNKSLNIQEAKSVLEKLNADERVEKILIFGELSSSETKELCAFPKAAYVDTTGDIERFFHRISDCHILITSDSLAVHLAMAARTPFVCFFGPTSAAEISDPTLMHINIKATGPSYCSYNPKAKIDGLTGDAVLGAATELIERLA